MARLNQQRQNDLEPKRHNNAIDKITALGFEIIIETNKMICFEYLGHIISFYPYSGWATGKTINDGRGLENLLKQLKN